MSSNDQASFLPASAEATEAQDWQAKFRDTNEIPAVIVIESESAFTPAQLGEVAANIGTQLLTLRFSREIATAPPVAIDRAVETREDPLMLWVELIPGSLERNIEPGSQSLENLPERRIGGLEDVFGSLGHRDDGRRLLEHIEARAPDPAAAQGREERDRDARPYPPAPSRIRGCG